MKPAPILFFLLLAAYQVSIQVFCFSKSLNLQSYIIPNIAVGILRFVLTFIYLFLGAHYIYEWARLRRKSIYMFLFVHIFLPYVLLFWSFKYRLNELFQFPYLLGFALVIYVFWLVWQRAIVLFVAQSFEIKEHDKKFFFANYPPTSRSDMRMFDFIYFLFILTPFIVPVNFGF